MKNTIYSYLGSIVGCTIAILFLFIIYVFVYVHNHFEPKKEISDKVIIKINEIRVSHKLKGLLENKILDTSATQKACDFVTRGYWAHQDPDGKFSWHLFVEDGYYYQSAGENLAKDCEDLNCVDLWMKSKKHKEVMLDSEYEDIGVGRCGEFLVIHLGSREKLF